MINKQIPEDIANEIFDILVEHAGVYDSESNRRQFIYHQGSKPDKWNKSGGCNEYRFGGKLGFGGKFWHNNYRFYVNCYCEDKGSKEEKIISTINELLIPIMKNINRENNGNS